MDAWAIKDNVGAVVSTQQSTGLGESWGNGRSTVTASRQFARRNCQIRQEASEEVFGTKWK